MDKTPKSPPIPRPPSKEGLEQISRDQELLTDDWTGDGPERGTGSDASKPQQPPDKPSD